MNFNQYVNNLLELLENNPEMGEYDTVYTTDDEGNTYDTIWANPSIGVYDESSKEFTHEEEKPIGDPNNAILIN